MALADTLVDDYDIIDLLDQLVAHCVTLLAADAAGILLADPREQLRPVAASSEDAETDGAAAVAVRRGAVPGGLPDRDPGPGPRPVAGGAIGGRGSWPPSSAAGAFASVHAIPLRLRGQAIGALNLFHREPGGLPDADLALGQALADVATIGILQERAIRRGEVLNEQLQAALHSRVVIEQAKGVVAQHLGVGMDAAFDRLRRYCRGNNLRLAEVARLLVDRELDLAVLTSSPVRTVRRTS